MGIFNNFRNAFNSKSNSNQNNINNTNNNNVSETMRKLEAQQERLNRMQNNANNMFNGVNTKNESYSVDIYDSLGRKTICTIDNNNRNQFLHLMQSIEIENSKIKSRMIVLEQQINPFLQNIEIARKQWNNGEISDEQFNLINYNNSSSVYNLRIEYENIKYYFNQNSCFLQYLNGYSAKFVYDDQTNNNYLYTRVLDGIKRNFETIKSFVELNMLEQGRNR